jgi:hypothetical protein
MAASEKPLEATAALIRHISGFTLCLMFRAALLLFALVAGASAAESRIDPMLLAAAQKAMPRGMATNELVRALELGRWNSNRTAVAISIKQPEASLVFVFLKQTNGTYLAADASGVEDGNFGVLGHRPRKDYERFETTPTEWLPRKDGLFQVNMRTRAWRAGKRYTVSEPLVIRPDGYVSYR